MVTYKNGMISLEIGVSIPWAIPKFTVYNGNGIEIGMIWGTLFQDTSKYINDYK